MLASLGCILGSVGRLLRREQRGSLAVTTTLALTLLCGLAGLAVDAGVWQTNKRNMQGAADFAAYSAAVAAHDGDDARLNGKAVAAQMGFVDGENGVSVAVNNPPTQGKYAGNQDAWEVVISQPQQMWFANLYLSSAPVDGARAVALAQVRGSTCILSLNPNAAAAIDIQGTTRVDTPRCNVQANSTSSAALTLGGSAKLVTNTVAVVGNYSVSGSAQLTASTIDAPGAQTVSDPYAKVGIPAYSGCDYSGLTVNKTKTLSPGVYCDGLTINSQAVVKFTPGVYIIDRGQFQVNGGAVVTGAGVTIILTSSTGSNYAYATINGGSNVTLTAPTTGATAGLLFYQDRNAPSGTVNTLNGGSTQTLNGALYFASSTVDYGGNSSAATCTQLVAGVINFVGNSSFNNDCAGTGVTQITGQSTVLTQ